MYIYKYILSYICIKVYIYMFYIQTKNVMLSMGYSFSCLCYNKCLLFGKKGPTLREHEAKNSCSNG